MSNDFTALSERLLDHVGEIAEKWQSDSPDDVIARGILSGAYPLMQALRSTEPREANGMILEILNDYFVAVATAAEKINALGKFKGA